jgi:glycosyltransferase 2 family protein
MPALTSPRPRVGCDRPTSKATRRRPGHRAVGRPGVRTRLATTGLLAALGISLLLSVPALRPVLRDIRDINPWWIAAAVALELASCVSFVIIFRLFFDRIGARDARAFAWTEMASGALLPGGGLGGYAIGGWLVHLTGASTRWIVRRSSALFFLTSSVNSAAVIGAGLLLLAGAGGPHDFTRSTLPALIAAAATLIGLALPRIASRGRTTPAWLEGIAVGIRDAQRTAGNPNWRLIGALGYPAFDMAVLWVAFSAVGSPPPLAALVLGYSIGYLATTLPIPGGIGVLDAGLSGALLLYGAAPAHVVAAVLVYHAIALWIPSLGGLIAYARLRPRVTHSSSADPPASPATHPPNRSPIRGPS